MSDDQTTKPYLNTDPYKVNAWAGFSTTDAVRAVACPKCGSPYGTQCMTPSGRKTDVHTERLVNLQKVYPHYDANAGHLLNSQRKTPRNAKIRP